MTKVCPMYSFLMCCLKYNRGDGEDNGYRLSNLGYGKWQLKKVKEIYFI